MHFFSGNYPDKLGYEPVSYMVKPTYTYDCFRLPCIPCICLGLTWIHRPDECLLLSKMISLTQSSQANSFIDGLNRTFFKHFGVAAIQISHWTIFPDIYIYIQQCVPSSESKLFTIPTFDLIVSSDQNLSMTLTSCHGGISFKVGMV